MVTDRYQHLLHHPDVDTLLQWAKEQGLTVVAIDNTPGSVPLETAELPERCLLLFGQEGPGVTEAARTGALMTCSMRSLVPHALLMLVWQRGIAMHAWIRQHADISQAW